MFEHVVLELRSKIQNLLVQTRGLAAHRALIELETVERLTQNEAMVGGSNNGACGARSLAVFAG